MIVWICWVFGAIFGALGVGGILDKLGISKYVQPYSRALLEAHGNVVLVVWIAVALILAWRLTMIEFPDPPEPEPEPQEVDEPWMTLDDEFEGSGEQDQGGPDADGEGRA